eukprot:2227938-Pleurochrysis_carterae.AAC.7
MNAGGGVRAFGYPSGRAGRRGGVGGDKEEGSRATTTWERRSGVMGTSYKDWRGGVCVCERERGRAREQTCG